MNTFCTLFDSNYIDKGLALYYSLERVAKPFRLYIFAFDAKSEEMLRELELEHAVIIGLGEFETPEMLAVKPDRTVAEYCWTCTPITVEYVLEKYGEECCTYIDADLYFFADPKVLLDELDENNASVLLTEHRFADTEDGRKALKKDGKYCVEFNAFRNNAQGLEPLKWWKERCLEWCYYRHEDDRMGDQKYLEGWTEKYEGVHELQHLGGGVAPWNIAQYTLVSADGADNTGGGSDGAPCIIMREKSTGKEFPLVFYHFQNIRYLNYDFVNIRSQCPEKPLKYAIYLPYLTEIERIRAMLRERFGFSVSLDKSCSGNPLYAFIQKNVMKYKIADRSDVIDLRKLR